ncbi:hypothetical protein BOTBODRAFT_175443 [Botryobasidium botryosum FD-172 SS1]|uniref:Uncharacterized protein n=1 Tax=Botryobasidium botryosum (strain FD-172 SS1) TaxID=930990 RepID=A0A067MPE5_BOTB1|nr:hypothetical protein BOTBODRAFT_175443 [Botryobasidium botryosum FD-172 SS1]
MDSHRKGTWEFPHQVTSKLAGLTWVLRAIVLREIRDRAKILCQSPMDAGLPLLRYVKVAENYPFVWMRTLQTIATTYACLTSAPKFSWKENNEFLFEGKRCTLGGVQCMTKDLRDKLLDSFADVTWHGEGLPSH